MDTKKNSRFTIKRETTASLLADSLRERIRSHEFADSEIIKQETLAEEYGVSRIPVREALIKLEAEGLLTRIQNKGYSVRNFTIEDIKELYEIRALLECDMLKRSIPLIEEKDLANAKDKLNDMYRILERDGQPENWSEINWLFHQSLYLPSRGKQSLEMAKNIYFHLVRYVHMQLKIDQSVDLERTMAEHKLILELSNARKVNDAAGVLHDHIIDARDDLVKFLRLQSKGNW
jgi:DNA-binding GntR family transcriptional regulator